MRESELRQHAKCGLCGKSIGHTGLPMFWVVTIERYGLRRDALMRQAGLTMQLGGNAVLAGVMGPDEEMTMDLMDPVKVTVCEFCATERSLPVAAMGEMA
jgi:hypothetical protein